MTNKCESLNYRCTSITRPTSDSTILHLDGKLLEFRDLGCSGTQALHRLGSRTVEVLRTCGTGEEIPFVRRLAAQPKDLVLEITEQYTDGRRFERRLVLEKQVLNKQ